MYVKVLGEAVSAGVASVGVFGVLQEPDLPSWKRYPLPGLGWGLQEVTAFCPSLSDIDPASGGSFVVQGDLLVLTIEL